MNAATNFNTSNKCDSFGGNDERVFFVAPAKRPAAESQRLLVENATESGWLKITHEPAAKYVRSETNTLEVGVCLCVLIEVPFNEPNIYGWVSHIYPQWR